MSNNNIIIAVIVVLVLAIGGYFLFANKASAPVTETTTTVPATDLSASSTDTGATVSVSATPVTTGTPTVITYTDSGFSPKTFTVKVGTTVRFVNNSSHGMWVAVGNHPTHTTYDGTTEQSHCSAGTDTNGSFDECTAVNPGTVYSFTFNKAGTFTFHNHVQASDGGSVTVTP